MNVGAHRARGLSSRVGRPFIFYVGCAIFLLLAVILISGLLFPPSDPSGADGDGDALEGRTLPAAQTAYEPSIESLSDLPSSEEVAVFDLGPSSSDDGEEGEESGAQIEVSLSDEATQAIEGALKPYKDEGIPVGFVFINLETGTGIAYNIDKSVYGASSIKGPYCTYVCQDIIDDGSKELTDSCRAYTDSFKKKGSTSIKALIKDSIVNSSNGSYAGLREGLGGNNYEEWLKSVDVNPGIHKDDDWFAWYSARDAAKMWMNSYLYLDTGSEAARYLEEQMSNTNRSFIRNGILGESNEDLVEFVPSTADHTPTQLMTATLGNLVEYKDRMDQVKGITILNKAGWCTTDKGTKTTYDSVCDNGIVSVDGVDYLLCLMSGARDTEANERRLSQLASAIFSAREDLAV